MRQFCLAATLFALAALLVGTAAWAQPAQQPRALGGQMTVDQAQKASPATDEVSRFEAWLKSVDTVSGDSLLGDSIRSTAAGAEYCEGAIDPGGIFCALACECTCNFGVWASQCCCEF